MVDEKQNWQVQIGTMLDTLTALPMLDGVAVWSLDTALRQSILRQSAQVQSILRQSAQVGALYGAGAQDGTMVPAAGTKTDRGTTKTAQRSAYQETRARRRQSEELLQI